MGYVSVKTKITLFNTFVLVLLAALLITIVLRSHMQASQENLAELKSQIQENLISKGKSISQKSAKVVAGFVEENAFLSINETIGDLVVSDTDVDYGIYMTLDREPWVIQTARLANPYAKIKDNITPLKDEQSVRVSESDRLLITEILYDPKMDTLSGRKKIPLYEFSVPVMFEDEITGFVRYGLNQRSLDIAIETANHHARRTLIEKLAYLVLIIFLVFCTTLFVINRLVSRAMSPLLELSGAAAKIADGNYDHELEINTNDEIGMLAENFTQMQLKIKTRLNDLKSINLLNESLAPIDVEREIFPLANQLLIQRFPIVNANYLSLKNLEFRGDEYCGFRFFDKSSGREVNVVNDRLSRESLDTKTVSCEIWTPEGNPELGIEPDRSPNRSLELQNDFDEFQIGSDQSGFQIFYLPITNGSALVGLILFDLTEQDYPFSPFDLDLIGSVRDQLVLSINRIRTQILIKEYNAVLEKKIEERTRDLARRTNDILSMLKNIELGMFTLTEDYTIHPEYSAYLETILEIDDIAGHSLEDVLISRSDLNKEAKDYIASALLATLGEEDFNFDLNSGFLPNAFSYSAPSGARKSLEIDWNPIILDGIVIKVMITIRDVTELLALQAQAEEQRAELRKIDEILKMEPQSFQDYIVDSQTRLNNARQSLENTSTDSLQSSQSTREAIDVLKREFHTIKGNARTCGFNYLSSVVHDLESYLIRLALEYGEVSIVAPPVEPFIQFIETLEKEINSYSVLANDKLNYDWLAKRKDEELGSQSIDQSELLGPLLTRLQAGYESTENMLACIEEAKVAVANLSLRPFETFVETVKNGLEDIALQLGKPAPEITIRGYDLYVSKPVSQSLVSILTHLFRNALDHGIEDPKARVEENKPEVGQITVDINREELSYLLEVKDDGKGLNIELLRQRYQESRNSATIESDLVLLSDLCELVFKSGVSTKTTVSDVSGRGVGLDAVRAELQALGGDIEIVLEGPNDSRFIDPTIELATPHVPFAFVISLPASIGLIM